MRDSKENAKFLKQKHSSTKVAVCMMSVRNFCLSGDAAISYNGVAGICSYPGPLERLTA
jgi:hypothetical protein